MTAYKESWRGLMSDFADIVMARQIFDEFHVLLPFESIRAKPADRLVSKLSAIQILLSDIEDHVWNRLKPEEKQQLHDAEIFYRTERMAVQS